MPHFYTTQGPLDAAQLGLILPHEHIFVDLRPQDTPGFGRANAADVVALMAPQLERARQAGVTALVECTPEGVGRRSDLVLAVAQAADFPVMLPTGIYREPWVPDWARQSSESELTGWMLTELRDGIAKTGVPAGFIKLSAGDDGLTPLETKILRAAARAGKETGAAIASHTIRGRVVADQLDVLAAEGYPLERFIWVHAQNEPDSIYHRALAQRGCWLEFDGIGGRFADEVYLDHLRRLVDAGFAGRLLLSQDRGWYSPGEPGGGIPKPFDYLPGCFLPQLRDAGFDEALVAQLTHDNPFRAFAR
jgi:phosphotriesterase-related protein